MALCDTGASINAIDWDFAHKHLNPKLIKQTDKLLFLARITRRFWERSLVISVPATASGSLKKSCGINGGPLTTANTDHGLI